MAKSKDNGSLDGLSYLITWWREARPAARNTVLVALVAMLLLFLAFVWPTLYRYDHMNDSLVRINRFTHSVDRFDGQEWRRLSKPPEPETPSSTWPRADYSAKETEPEDMILPPSARKRIHIEVDRDRVGWGQYPLVTIKNESTWTITTFSFTIWMGPKGGGERIYKAFRMRRLSEGRGIYAHFQPLKPYTRDEFTLFNLTEWEPEDFAGHDWGFEIVELWGIPPLGYSPEGEVDDTGEVETILQTETVEEEEKAGPEEIRLSADLLKQLRCDISNFAYDWQQPKAVVANETTWTVTMCTVTVWLAPKDGGKRATKHITVNDSSYRYSQELPIQPYGSLEFALESETGWKADDYMSHKWGIEVTEAWGYPPADSAAAKDAEDSGDIEESENDAAPENYILSDSDRRLLTETDLAGLSFGELTLARNEIYARHGYTFSVHWVAEYFESKSWYTARGNQTPEFSDIERRNLNLLISTKEESGNAPAEQEGEVYF